MIKYKTGYSKDSIEEIEVIRETEKCVFIKPYWSGVGRNERRESKISDFGRYYDSWDEPHHYLVDEAHDRVKFAESRLKDECKKREKVEKLTQPS